MSPCFASIVLDLATFNRHDRDTLASAALMQQLPRVPDRDVPLAHLAVMLGGRTAEEFALRDVTTGAENDLVAATRLARQMVTR